MFLFLAFQYFFVLLNFNECSRGYNIILQLSGVDGKGEESSPVDTPSQDPNVGKCLIMICNLHTECGPLFSKPGLCLEFFQCTYHVGQ